jgi:3',5'-cyclic AMP phosphodiesterase CpdA
LVCFQLGSFSTLSLTQAVHPQPPIVNFAVIGDSGSGDEHQLNVARQMVAYHDRHRYEFVIMLGDNVYPWGSPGDYRKKFEIPYAELLKREVKFYAVLGNHDVSFGRGEFAIKYPLFNMGGRRYYTFTKGDGMVQFFALDSNTLAEGKRDETQLNWLRKELADSKALWKIAYFHHPIYSSGKRHGPDVRMRAVLEPILIEGGIRVVFSGHDHVYERINPQHDIYYFVSGSAGKLRRGNLDPKSPLTIKGNDQVRHFIYVEIQNRELMFEAVSEQGEVFDRGTLSLPRVSGK